MRVDMSPDAVTSRLRAMGELWLLSQKLMNSAPRPIEAAAIITNWEQLAGAGRFDEAEPQMLAETDMGDGLFPVNEVRATFYESWGDALDNAGDRIAKYIAAQHNWEQWASCSTSGGEGTARMSEVKRVAEKISRLSEF